MMAETRARLEQSKAEAEETAALAKAARPVRRARGTGLPVDGVTYWITDAATTLHRNRECRTFNMNKDNPHEVFNYPPYEASADDIRRLGRVGECCS